MRRFSSQFGTVHYIASRWQGSAPDSIGEIPPPPGAGTRAPCVRACVGGVPCVGFGRASHTRPRVRSACGRRAVAARARARACSARVRGLGRSAACGGLCGARCGGRFGGGPLGVRPDAGRVRAPCSAFPASARSAVWPVCGRPVSAGVPVPVPVRRPRPRWRFRPRWPRAAARARRSRRPRFVRRENGRGPHGASCGPLRARASACRRP